MKIQFFAILIGALLFTACKKDDARPLVPTGNSKSYTVRNTDLSDITGFIEFIENDNNSTTINLNLNNTVPGVENSVHLRGQTANIGGGIAAILNKLNENTGKSSTTISKLSNGTPISYEQLLDFNGFVAVESSDGLTAYADIGPNEPTGNQVVYTLFLPEDSSFMGLATFEERKRGTSSLVVSIQNIESDAIHLSHIHNEEAGSENEVLIELSPVEGKYFGNGFSEIRLFGQVTITYSELLQLNASIDVHSTNDTALIIAKGGIGSNPSAIVHSP